MLSDCKLEALNNYLWCVVLPTENWVDVEHGYLNIKQKFNI